jgi:uncharacterized protein (TIGR00725 family)
MIPGSRANVKHGLVFIHEPARLLTRFDVSKRMITGERMKNQTIEETAPSATTDRSESKNSCHIPPIAVGVMGSAGGSPSRAAFRKVHRLGQEIAERGYVLITGACPGLPHEAVQGAKSKGGITVGISPALNFGEHMMKYKSPCRGYDAIIYTGSGLMGREIENIRSCDLVVFAGGRSGTLGEFAIAYDEAKVIGVLLGTGGITENLETIIGFINKDTGAKVIYDEDPMRLMERLVEVYDRDILPYYRSVVANRNPDGELER